jgi:hypothetical protein
MKEAPVFRRLILPWALVFGLSGSFFARALAADAPQDKPATVQLGAVALPVVVNGRLINYVFVTVKLDLSPTADGAVVRSKEPFFRDALVRAGHRTPFTLASDYTRLDDKRIRAEVISDAAVILGRGVLANVEIVKQVSQRRSGLPPPPGRPQPPELVP